MTKFTLSLQKLGNCGLSNVKPLSTCYNALTTGLNRSYRQTKICCKKLCRSVKKACATTDANKAMMMEQDRVNHLRHEQEAVRRNNESLTMMLLTFMLLFNNQKTEQPEQDATFGDNRPARSDADLALGF